jgi:nicotinamide riboside transporter PnuC
LGLFADGVAGVHTSTMTLRNATILAIIGTALLSALLAADLIVTISGVLRDVVPLVTLLRSIVYVLASVTVTVFFYVFHKVQL